MTETNPGADSPILLAFSGGLDTSFLVPWLKETYGRPVLTLTVDTGGIDAAAAKVLEQRSKQLGAIGHHLVDARKTYFEQVLRFLIMGNVRRGQLYPLCVGAERAIQAQTLASRAPCPPPHGGGSHCPGGATRLSSALNSSSSWRTASCRYRRLARLTR
jgi:hypothetical protein